MASSICNQTRVGIREFVHKAIRLDNEAFKEAMRLDNNDKDIDNINIPAWTEDEINAYGRQ